MHGQGNLAFIHPLPRRPDRPERIFTGVLPDAATARSIDALRWRLVDDLGLEGSQIPARRLHISLHHLCDDRRVRPKYAYGTGQAAAEIVAAPFEVVFDSLETFRPPPGREYKRPTVLRGGSAELTELQRALGAALQRQNLRGGTRFKAHITLCYGPKAVIRQAIEPIRFRVDNFVLIHSERGLGRYNILGRWALTG